jgi:heme exporter protein A
MTAIALAVEGVGKSFGRSVVLRDVTLEIGVGECVAVFGPNGAGKSTMLRLLAGLMAPTMGRLRVFGVAGADAATRRRIGLVAHQSFLYPDLSARENLIFYAKMYGLDQNADRVSTWLERVRLTEAGERPIRSFSRGMEQRLALARALLHDPEVVLLDEPWSGLDAGAADWLTDLLRDLRTRGRTIVVSTHEFQRGLDVASRVLIVHRGRIAYDDAASPTAPVEAIYRRITGSVAA